MKVETSSSHLCWYTTLDDAPCENRVADGSRYCWRHQGLPGAAAGPAGHELSLGELGKIFEDERQHYEDVYLAAGGAIASDSRLEPGTIEGGDRHSGSGIIVGPADAVAFGYGKRVGPFADDALGGAAHYAEEDHWATPDFAGNPDSNLSRKKHWTTRLKDRFSRK